jgi:predicted AlkP superfamily pyrophosphatase or phosphodiesterase
MTDLRRWRGALVALAMLVASACAPPRVTQPSVPPGAGAPTAAAGSTRAASGGTNRPEHRQKPYVILVSFDGMRWDYLERFDPPNIGKVMRAGVHAEGLVPVFPSKTFPNHYSIVTGLYAENHGIVANSFYDPVRGETYALGDQKTVADGSWYRGDPIWVTAETQGMVAACFFWPGSEAAIGGVRPTLWNTYDGTIPNERRVDTVIEWLERPPETRPHMITLYFSDVDGASHTYGPEGEHARDAVMKVDRAMGRLLGGLDRLPYRDHIYLVLVSDHGMSETSDARTTMLPTLLDVEGLVVPDSGPAANIHVSGGVERTLEVRDLLNQRLSHGRAYVRSEVPERLHYRADARIGDVVVVMEEHYMVEMPRVSSGSRPFETFGMHGWDPKVESMHGIFVASGPGIPPGTTIGRFENIHLYPWMAELLGLQPASPIDGTPGLLQGLIRKRSISEAPAR